MRENIDDLISKGNGKIKGKNLKKYTRQYLGYINNEDEVIIYINFIYTKNIDNEWKPRFKEELQLVMDGGMINFCKCATYYYVYKNKCNNKLFYSIEKIMILFF